MNTTIKAIIITGIVIALIFIIGKNIYQYAQFRKQHYVDMLNNLREFFREEQDHLAWVCAERKCHIPDIISLAEIKPAQVSLMNEETLRFLIQKINKAIAQLDGQTIKHPEKQARAGVAVLTIEKLKEGNAKTSRSGRRATQCARDRTRIQLSSDDRASFG